MDPAHLNLFASLLSGIAQMCAIIVMISCTINFFSSLKPGKSMKIVFFSLFYFFAFGISLAVAAQLLISAPISDIFRSLGGIAALVGASLLHLSFGFLALALYLRYILSEIRSLAV